MQDSEIRKLCEEVEEYCSKATPGPWEAGRPDMATIVDGVDSKWIYAGDQYLAVASGRIDGEWSEVMANANLIARARTDLPKLVSLLRSKLEGERWIPVSESPDIPGWYQVWRKSGLNPLCGSPVESAYWCDGWVTHPEITHWRPLASSPEVMG